MWAWLDQFLGLSERARLRMENSRLGQQYKDVLDSLASQHNRLAQERYRREVAERQLAKFQALNNGPLRFQPIIIYPPGTEGVPIEPVAAAFEEVRDWVAQELGQPVFRLLPLMVVWAARPLAAFQANMIAECRQVVWDDLKMPLPPAPNPHVVCLVRGMGGFAGTVAQDWRAPIVGLGDACLEALAGLLRPYAMDNLHPDWPEEYKTRAGQTGTLAHEVCWHGLAKDRGKELGYVGEHPVAGSPAVVSISGEYGLFPNVHFTEAEKKLILENLREVTHE